MPRVKTNKEPATKQIQKKVIQKDVPATPPLVAAPSLFKAVLNWLTPPKAYALAGLVVLLASTWYWALLGARIHMGNADQLVNTYLFNDMNTFRGASWPDQHTFLLKWPLFIAIRLFGATTGTFTAFTVAIVLLTVGLLAFILYRIERRPLVFGTLCLALASVLLLVPAQPYPGGVLPVNMAMVTTRNIEYLVFVAAIAFFVYTPRFRHWKFGAGVGLLAVLVASDKLFLTLGAGGAVLALLVYALARKWSMVSLSARWLAASLAGGFGALCLLWIIKGSGLTDIASGSLAGPYGFAHTIKDLALGSVYAALGFLTNMGANPASDTRLLATIPAQAHNNIFSQQGIALIMNGLLFLAALGAAVRLLWSSIVKRSTGETHDNYFKISLMLVWTTIAAFGVFVVSKHYYPVDARYLTIILFAAFIALATAARPIKWQPRTIVVIGIFFGFSIMAGITTADRAYDAESGAMAATNKRDELVARAIDQHGVDSLVGDYWRVFPTKLVAHNDLNVVPMSSCAQPGGILSSKVWQPDLSKRSFAYLLTLDQSLTGYPPCSLDQIIANYGRPNASTLIAGTLKQPRELLLFYDRGAHNSAPRPTPISAVPSTVVPVTLDELPYTSCAVPTVMNIVAHQDDDLLFMNPDLLHDIKAGHCVRTIYVTSGDAGADRYYWVGREQGSEAAYSSMLGTNEVWIERLVKLPGGQFITVANPRGNSKISLIFMHLPDGNLHGEGFRASHFESLERLEAGQISVMHAVDHQSIYTVSDVSGALTTLMHLYQPAEVRTQAGLISKTYADHSDHMAVGRVARASYNSYLTQQYEDQVAIPLKFYIGYPIRGMEPNVVGADLENKARIFFAYAKYDNSVCRTMQQCTQHTNYGSYLEREYQNSY